MMKLPTRLCSSQSSTPHLILDYERVFTSDLEIMAEIMKLKFQEIVTRSLIWTINNFASKNSFNLSVFVRRLNPD